jgi:hypothetical protein
MINGKDDNQLGIRILQLSVAKWKEDLSDFECSLFMTHEWVEAVSSDNRFPVFLNFTIKGKVIGKLAGLWIKLGRLKGDQLFFYAGPALKKANQDLWDGCCQAILDFARQNRVQRILMGSYDQPTDMACQVPGFHTNERFEYVVNLQPETGEISFSQNLKRNVKKAKKLQATLVNGNDPGLLGRLVELLNNTLEQRVSKYGKEYDPFYLPHLNEASLQRLIESKAGKFYRAILDGDVVSHSVLFNLEARGRAFNLLVGSDELSYQYGLAALADYELVHLYQSAGFRFYNLGGGTGDAGSAGLERSKQSKGAEKMMVYGATTNYLCYPHRLINPLLNIGRSFPHNHWLVNLIKRFG